MNWIFFFAVNIGMIYFVQTKIKKISIRYIISAIIIASVFYNAHKQCKVFLTPLGESKEINQTQQVVDHSPFADETFVQNHNAIITLPAVLVGSENLGYHEQGMHLMRFAFLASLESGLPIVSSIMSRTSIQETIDKVSFLLGPYNKSNNFLSTLPDGNYVVLADMNALISRNGEQLIYQNADSLWSFSNYWVGTISKDRLNQIYAVQVPDSGDIHPIQALY